VAGVDEVGRGPLAGPVFAAAIILPDNHNIKGLKDSKKLTENKREKLFYKIKKESLAIGIGSVNEKKIDRINIREATFLAMELALSNLSLKPARALIDGFSLKNQNIPNKGIVRGDNKVDAIKAASIIAKVTRDRLMCQYDFIFPEYDFKNNKGYGTANHINGLKKYKSSPIHRKTFNPVTQYMPTFKWLVENNRICWMGNKFAGLFLLKKQYIFKNRIDLINSDYNIYITEKNNIIVNVVVFTKFKNFGVLFNKKKTILENKIHSKIKEELMNIYLEQNNFRFDIINVTLNKNNPLIQHIKNVSLK